MPEHLEGKLGQQLASYLRNDKRIIDADENVCPATTAIALFVTGVESVSVAAL